MKDKCDDTCKYFGEGPYLCSWCSLSPQIMRGECAEITQRLATNEYRAKADEAPERPE